MDKKIKQTKSDSAYIPISSFGRKIKPLKLNNITFLSHYDYGNEYDEQILKILLKNPKWCNLNLKLGHIGEYKMFPSLRRAKSLRLRSVHLSSYAFDSQFCGDEINRYYGELSPFERAGHTLKKLSLSVTHDVKVPRYRGIKDARPDAFFRLKKFVKKQKHLEEFGIYMGRCGTSEWMANLLAFMEKNIKILTIENISVDKIFQRYEFPKLEMLTFGYHLIHGGEDSFDFSILKRTLPNIFALPSLKDLVISQFHRYNWDSYFAEGRNEDLSLVEILPEFWEAFRAELHKHEDKPLKIKYRKQEDSNVEEKLEHFKRIFTGLPPGQTFDYDVVWINTHSDEEEDEEEYEEDEERRRGKRRE